MYHSIKTGEHCHVRMKQWFATQLTYVTSFINGLMIEVMILVSTQIIIFYCWTRIELALINYPQIMIDQESLLQHYSYTIGTQHDVFNAIKCNPNCCENVIDF